MLFPTVRFAVFFAVAWAVLLAVRDRPVARRLVLLGASWFFYASWNWRFLGLLWWVILANHVAVRLVARASTPGRQRLATAFGVALNLGLLAYFKYYGFFTESLVHLLDRVGVSVYVPLLQVVLPLGISFLTFQAISYVIEVRRGVLEPVRLLDEAVWLSFFPTVVSGPITRPSELVPQLQRRPRCEDPEDAVRLVLRGVFKKVVVASYLATSVVEGPFATPTAHTSLELLFAVYAFGALIYVDFSGYTDIARGGAMLLGYRLPENFDAPYRAATVQEFWKRWHMTLTRWLRDFLFTPLGLRWSRRPLLALSIPIIVMLLAGLWHGAAWTFVVFGGVHGLAMATERWRRERRRHLRLGRPPDTPLRVLGRHVWTLHVVSLGWLFFRAESLGTAWTILARIVTGAGGLGEIPGLAALTVAGVLAVQFVPGEWRLRLADLPRRLGPVTQVAAIATTLTVIDVLGPEGVAPFIYFQF